MRIALVGDIGLFGINTINNKLHEKRFKYVADELSGYDLTVGNLETPLTDSNRTVGGKSAYIKGFPADARILSNIGIDYVSLANNHIYDYRRKGLCQTLDALEKANVKWYGVDSKYCNVENGSERIRLRGYCCYSTNPKKINGNGSEEGVNPLDPVQMAKDLKKDNSDGYLSIISCHWGEEHIHYPNLDHIETARNLAKHFNVIVHGHHPHVLQGIETCNESLIAYSLGNFCFDDVFTKKSDKPLIHMSEGNKQYCILEISVIDGKIQGWKPHLFYDKDGIIRPDEDVRKLYLFEEWSKRLDTVDETYLSERNRLLQKYINGRIKARDLNWFFKRLNVDSAKMIYSGIMNKRKYNKIMRTYKRILE